MPVILLQRIPLPSLRTYTAVSVALLACAVFYAHNDATSAVESKQNTENPNQRQDGEPQESARSYIHGRKFEALEYEKEIDETINFTEVLFPFRVQNATDPESNSYGVKMATVLLGETWCIWSLVNMACCCLILLGRGIQKIVFGDLRVSEQQHLRDKFWNFAFYKFIFIFGVMNVQSMEEVVLWCSWFGILACLHLLAQLCKDRFEYLSFSPTTPMRTHIKVLLLLLGIQTTCTALFAACIFIGYMFVGINIFAFMAAEVFLLMIKTVYVMVRYGIHLWDLHHDRVWENRSVYVYYSELVFELIAISVDFCNHLHMLVWSNIFLSMASLVICMQLRYLFYELQRRVRRHKNYLRVVTTMDEKFSMATPEELEHNNDACAICWEKMENARKLPCGHFFHNACLRSWLEQDTSCPICRKSLTDLQTAAPPRPGPEATPGDTPPTANLQRNPINHNMTNHFFHFDASRYVSWLPSFSVEVSHTQLLGNRMHAHQHMQTNSQLDNMARQVQDVFPHYPIAVILGDLQLTRSIELTIENIVEGRLVVPPTFPRTDNQDSDTESSGSGSESDSSFSAASTRVPSGEQEAMSEGLYDPLPLYNPTLPPASSLNFVVNANPPSTELSSEENSDTNSQHRDEFPAMSGGRFSKSPTEREAMLMKRKESMLEQARRKFVIRDVQASPVYPAQAESAVHRTAPGGLLSDQLSDMFVSEQSLLQSSNHSDTDTLPSSNLRLDSEAEMDIAQRRERAFLAAQRRLQRE